MDAPKIPPSPAMGPVDSGEKALAILCHVSFFLGVGFLLPLIVYLVKRDQSLFVATHAKEVLNFHISLLIYSICAFILIFVLIGFPLLIAIAIFGVVCAIIGAIKASESTYYYYPLTIRLF